jgi:DNA-nicking Smr family endonuclease
MAKVAGNPAQYSNDRAIWAEAMRGVTPLRGRAVPSPSNVSINASEPPRTMEGSSVATEANLDSIERFAGIDRANAERLKRGRHPIEARLDLHGMTQAEAHGELVAFVEACCRAGRRCVLVITGRGMGPDGPGVLKTLVPRWLEEVGLRQRILAHADAQPRHGGAGALYLLLRRQRRASIVRPNKP